MNNYTEDLINILDNILHKESIGLTASKLDLDNIKDLIWSGADVNAGYFGRNALYVAVKYGDLDLVELCFTKNVDVYGGQNPDAKPLPAYTNALDDLFSFSKIEDPNDKDTLGILKFFLDNKKVKIDDIKKVLKSGFVAEKQGYGFSSRALSDFYGDIFDLITDYPEFQTKEILTLFMGEKAEFSSNIGDSYYLDKFANKKDLAIEFLNIFIKWTGREIEEIIDTFSEKSNKKELLDMYNESQLLYPSKEAIGDKIVLSQPILENLTPERLSELKEISDIIYKKEGTGDQYFVGKIFDFKYEILNYFDKNNAEELFDTDRDIDVTYYNKDGEIGKRISLGVNENSIKINTKLNDITEGRSKIVDVRFVDGSEVNEIKSLNENPEKAFIPLQEKDKNILKLLSKTTKTEYGAIENFDLLSGVDDSDLNDMIYKKDYTGHVEEIYFHDHCVISKELLTIMKDFPELKSISIVGYNERRDEIKLITETLPNVKSIFIRTNLVGESPEFYNSIESLRHSNIELLQIEVPAEDFITLNGKEKINTFCDYIRDYKDEFLINFGDNIQEKIKEYTSYVKNIEIGVLIEKCFLNGEVHYQALPPKENDNSFLYSTMSKEDKNLLKEISKIVLIEDEDLVEINDEDEKCPLGYSKNNNGEVYHINFNAGYETKYNNKVFEILPEFKNLTDFVVTAGKEENIEVINLILDKFPNAKFLSFDSDLIDQPNEFYSMLEKIKNSNLKTLEVYVPDIDDYSSYKGKEIDIFCNTLLQNRDFDNEIEDLIDSISTNMHSLKIKEDTVEKLFTELSEKIKGTHSGTLYEQSEGIHINGVDKNSKEFSVYLSVTGFEEDDRENDYLLSDIYFDFGFGAKPIKNINLVISKDAKTGEILPEYVDIVKEKLEKFYDFTMSIKEEIKLIDIENEYEKADKLMTIKLDKIYKEKEKTEKDFTLLFGSMPIKYENETDLQEKLKQYTDKGYKYIETERYTEGENTEDKETIVSCEFTDNTPRTLDEIIKHVNTEAFWNDAKGVELFIGYNNHWISSIPYGKDGNINKTKEKIEIEIKKIQEYELKQKEEVLIKNDINNKVTEENGFSGDIIGKNIFIEDIIKEISQIIGNAQYSHNLADNKVSVLLPVEIIDKKIKIELNISGYNRYKNPEKEYVFKISDIKVSLPSGSYTHYLNIDFEISKGDIPKLLNKDITNIENTLSKIYDVVKGVKEEITKNDIIDDELEDLVCTIFDKNIQEKYYTENKKDFTLAIETIAFDYKSKEILDKKIATYTDKGYIPKQIKTHKENDVNTTFYRFIDPTKRTLSEIIAHVNNSSFFNDLRANDNFWDPNLFIFYKDKQISMVPYGNLKVTEEYLNKEIKKIDELSINQINNEKHYIQTLSVAYDNELPGEYEIIERDDSNHPAGYSDDDALVDAKKDGLLFIEDMPFIQKGFYLDTPENRENLTKAINLKINNEINPIIEKTDPVIMIEILNKLGVIGYGNIDRALSGIFYLNDNKYKNIEKSITEIFKIELFKNYQEIKPQIEKLTKEKQIEKEERLENLKNNGLLITDIPMYLRDKDICLVAVSKDGSNLTHVPLSLRTKELCLVALKTCGTALYFCPENLKTVDMCVTAIKHAEGPLNKSLVLSLVPQKIKKEVELLMIDIDKSLNISTKELNKQNTVQNPISTIDVKMILKETIKTENDRMNLLKEIINFTIENENPSDKNKTEKINSDEK